ncbi:UvrD-helicase domain-containing protein [Undibacterium sp. TS12]|uniref:UvrD-helicase domain-containing protein n=1 Tax=Undibacterium sp. TS12 TaxID=2908202 RepID=UPI001F4C6FB6|nr:UvrD-helicase domain-containing protein [Undibacterium sp. TS12]MCH8618025.1 UvrD-helicase domain-containing protein [Undibacterium sp. TS12]
MDIRSLVESMADFFRGTYAWVLRNAPPLVAKTIPSHIRKIHEDGYKSGHQKGYKVGKEAGHKVGYALGEKTGYENGSLAGEESGYQRGLEEGKNIWVITDERAIGSTSIDQSVYGPQKFEITDEMRRNMQKEVADAVAKRIIPPPTDDQWKMIFADGPATCITAGAGSGKSTTLILRVIFMLKHLKIQKNEITVVSFTTAACEDLRYTLVKVIKHWGDSSFEYEDAKKLVRTFHSMLLQMSKRILGKIDFFENLKVKNEQGPVEVVTSTDDKDILDDEFGLEDVENPFSSMKLSDLQVTALKESYIALYNSDETFRLHIDAMRQMELKRSVNNDIPENIYDSIVTKIASARDKSIVEKINEKIRISCGFPESNFEIGPLFAFEAFGYQFFANGFVPSEGKFVFIGGFFYEDRLFDSEETILDPSDNSKRRIYHVIKVKKNIISRYLGSKHYYINSPDSMKNFKGMTARFDMDGYAKKVLEPISAPIFNIQLDGEIIPSPIFEAFYSQASFIESMGLEVSKAIKKMRPYRSQCLEYHFSNALPRFWRQFENDLRTRKMATFNFAFLELASENMQEKRIHDRMLMPFSHLLIDEFQDISPQIVAWLLKNQRRIVERRDLAMGSEDVDPSVSLMAIGDDRQSIYGWRGSVPSFFKEFDRHFPSHPWLGKASRLPMVENFRSIEPIVRGSEILLSSNGYGREKECTTRRLSEPGDHGIKFEPYKDLDEETKARIVEKITEQHAYVSGLKKTYKNKVIVMSRRNETLNAIRPLIKDLPGVVFYTYHRAKGLQGEVAVLIEDCVYENTHKLRNRVYECVDWLPEGFTYDKAQSDEAVQLAYVATTRGMRRVIWFIEGKKEKSKGIGAAARFQIEKMQEH